MNGKWKGNFQSSYHDFKENLPVILIIEQSWSKICIKGKFNHSKSSSDTSIKVNLGKEIMLHYSYYNDKNQNIIRWELVIIVDMQIWK